MTVATFQPTQLADPEFHATGDIHSLWRWMRGEAPVHWHPLAGYPGFWSVTRYEDVRAVYRDPATFSSAYGVLLRPANRGGDPGGGLTLALTDPPRHRGLRSLMASQFDVRAARSLESVILEDVREALSPAVERGSCDLAQDVAARLSICLICRVLGIPAADFDQIYHWTHEAFAAHKPLAAHLPIMRYFVELVSERLASPGHGVAWTLAHGRVDGEPLTETEIVLNVENLVGATENAGLSMATGMLAFLEHPDQWRRLEEDRALLITAIEEVLRWASSATHSMRTATRAYVLGGQAIAPGEHVVLWLPSANRDEYAFEEPDRFDISRRPNRHLAFGLGEHVCIGASIARVQLGILLTELLDTVSLIELTAPPAPLRSIAVNGPAELPVRIVPK